VRRLDAVNISIFNDDRRFTDVSSCSYPQEIFVPCVIPVRFPDIVRYDPMHQVYESYEKPQKIKADEKGDFDSRSR